MQRAFIIATAAALLFGSTSGVLAGTSSSEGVGGTAAAEKSGITAEQRARLSEKLQLIGQIMRQVDGGREAVTAEQRQWLLTSMYKMSLGQVRAMGVPGGYAETADSLSRASKLSAKALGDQPDDLVYTPFNPCRFIDTRNVGGKITGAQGYDLANTGTSYGGVGTCDPKTLLGITDENLIGAIALNMTIVDTSTAASPGFATVRPAGSTNATALVNWTTSSAGFQLGNAAVVSTDQSGLANEFEIFTSGSVHAIVDFFGAFLMPGATALDCVRTLDTSQTIPTNISSLMLSTQACATGYTMTGGGCAWLGGSLAVYLLKVELSAGNAIRCQYNNLSGSTQTAYMETRCCRVPGR